MMILNIDFRRNVPSYTPVLSRLVRLAAWAGAVAKALDVAINVSGTANALKSVAGNVAVRIDVADPSRMVEGLERFMKALASVTGAGAEEWSESSDSGISRFIKVADVVVQIDYDEGGNVTGVILTA